MLVNLIAFALLSFCAGVQGQACNTLPSLYVNYTLMEMYSPYDVLRSSQTGYNCTSAFLTGPGPLENGNYTWIMIRNNKVLNSADLYKGGNDANATMFLTCTAGQTFQYRFLTFNGNFFITYICNPAGQTIDLLRGYGHNEIDGASMDAILAQYNLQYTNNAAVANAAAGCKPSPSCTDFYL